MVWTDWGGNLLCNKKTAKIVSYLQNNPKCGFKIAMDKPPYKGTRGTWHVKIIQNQEQEILKILMKKYLGSKESTLSRYLNNNSEAKIALEILPQNIFNYYYSKRMKDVWLMIDEGYPTCSWKRHTLSKVESNEDSSIQFLKCQNCKKIWTY